jgi:ribonuclease PH
MLIDPTTAEERAAERHISVAMDTGKQRVAHMAVDGVFSAAELRDALGLALSACSYYDPLLRKCLEDRLAQLQR